MRETPGPPLLAEPEYCATAAPTASEYLRAAGAGFLAAVTGGLLLFLAAVATNRLWGILAVAIGLACGLAVHRGASRLRSVGLGVLAAICTAAGLGFGYLLLFHPQLLTLLTGAWPVTGALRWFDLLFNGAALFIAYRTAGPVRREREEIWLSGTGDEQSP
jgi:hypothetical protein